LGPCACETQASEDQKNDSVRAAFQVSQCAMKALRG
jgi:hypothetical protein